jgi:NIPSNAP protein
MRLVEIRSYRLLPGTRPEFARLFRDEALPMLERAKVDVVGFGGSPDDPNAAFLIRAFDNLADRQAQEDAFYGSDAWRKGPREPILACIETFTDTVLTLDDATVDGLRTVGIGH